MLPTGITDIGRDGKFRVGVKKITCARRQKGLT